MSKILPIIMPPIETYQDSAFILAVLLAHDNTKNVFYNNYINWSCTNTNCLVQMNLHFSNVTWEDYRRLGIAEMNLYHINTIARKYFVSFLKERIDQENYILLYHIDEHYLSYSNCYMKEHFIHDTYIYGYTDDYFHVMAYSNNKLKMLTIPSDEILNSIYHCLSTDPHTSFCTFRPSHAVSIQVEQSIIMHSFIEYISGDISHNDNIVSGIHVYDVLQKCIIAYTNAPRSTNQDLDLRVFRMIWEHKKVLKHHIQLINSSYLKQIDQIEKKSKIIFSLALKYDITEKRSLLNRILNYISEIKQQEISLIQTFIES